jgi:hypothetical protein
MGLGIGMSAMLTRHDHLSGVLLYVRTKDTALVALGLWPAAK